MRKKDYYLLKKENYIFGTVGIEFHSILSDYGDILKKLRTVYFRDTLLFNNYSSNLKKPKVA